MDNQKTIVFDKSWFKFPFVEGIQWVANIAKADNDTRYDLRVIEIKGGCITATDAKRIHQYFIDPDELPNFIEDGYYRVIENKKNMLILEKDDSIKFPDWTKVYPAHKDFRVIDLTCNLKDDMSLSFGYATTMRNQEETINFRFFEDLYRNNTYSWNLVVYDAKNKGGPVIFQNEDKLAAIMPMRF